MEAKTIDYGAIGWAINHVRHGHKMRRKIWPAGAFISLDADQPNIILHGTTIGQWRPEQRDILAADWEMLNPTLPGEYHA